MRIATVYAIEIRLSINAAGGGGFSALSHGDKIFDQFIPVCPVYSQAFAQGKNVWTGSQPSSNAKAKNMWSFPPILYAFSCCDIYEYLQIYLAWEK
jgi:hypothetical protein